MAAAPETPAFPFAPGMPGGWPAGMPGGWPAGMPGMNPGTPPMFGNPGFMGMPGMPGMPRPAAPAQNKALVMNKNFYTIGAAGTIAAAWQAGMLGRKSSLFAFFLTWCVSTWYDRPIEQRCKDCEAKAKDDEARRQRREIGVLPELVAAKAELLMPRLFFATEGKEQRTAELVASAVRAGFRGIHVGGDQHRLNETGVSAALADVKRSRLFIQVQVDPIAAKELDPDAPISKQVAASIAASLSKLGLEYADAVVLRAPYPNHQQTMEAWRALEEAVRDGLVRQLGISGITNVQELQQVYADAKLKPTIVMQPFQRQVDQVQRGISDWCAERHVYLQSYPMCSRAGLSGAKEEVKALAAQYGVTEDALCLRFVMSLGLIPVVDSESGAQLEDDLSALRIPLTNGHAKYLDVLIRGALPGRHASTAPSSTSSYARAVAKVVMKGALRVLIGPFPPSLEAYFADESTPKLHASTTAVPRAAGLPTREPKQNAAGHTYDYFRDKWDKFDVNAAMAEADKASTTPKEARIPAPQPAAGPLPASNSGGLAGMMENMINNPNIQNLMQDPSTLQRAQSMIANNPNMWNMAQQMAATMMGNPQTADRMQQVTGQMMENNPQLRAAAANFAPANFAPPAPPSATNR